MRLRLVLVGLFFALMFVYVGVNSYVIISHFNAAGDPGWQMGLDSRVQTYRDISEADASVLRDGDEVVALNGQEFKNSPQYFKTFRHIPPGASYPIVVRRNGQMEEFTLRTASYPLWIRINVVMFPLVIPAIFLLTGLGVLLLRSNDKQAVLLALTLGMFWASFPPASLLVADVQPWWLADMLIAAYLIAASLFAVILHFFLIFPERSPILRRFPRLEYYLYPLFLLIGYPFVVISAFRLATGTERFYEVYREFPLLFAANLTITSIYLLGGLLSLAVNYRKANQLSRRKLRVVLVGTVAGFLPFLLTNIAFFIFRPSVTPLWAVVISAAYLVLALIPLSFAYAILRHQVIPVSLIIRRSVQYLLAKNVLRVILALPIIGLAVTIIANPHRTLADLLFRNSIYFYSLLVVAAATSLVFRRRLGDWLDRKFFREAYNQEKILRALVDDVKRLDSIPEMSERVTEQVSAALHPERVYLFYRDEAGHNLSLSYTSGGTSHELRIPEDFQLLRFMELQGGAQDFPFPQKNNLPQSEKAWLANLETRFIVPMTGTDGHLSGLLLLGEKKSEVPYTASDRELLEALAGQIAIVYENVRLKTRVDRERKIKREVLSRIEGQNINLLRECPVCGACYDSPARTCAKDNAELTLSLPVERTVEERYRLDQLIGRGGMGAVYEALDLRLNRKVAVKILTGSMFGDSAALRRFEREAQTVARLNHPNIITVYDYGALSTEGAYLVMELAHGETLGTALKRNGRIHPRVAAEWFDHVLDGVKAAHHAGVVHRDLKPENILISKGENRKALVRILDFGLAKITQQTIASTNSPTAPVTTPGTVMGTFGYMSPEQLMGGSVDERSDLFSIGVMVVEALTGRRPFGGKTYHELLTNILQGSFHIPGNSQEAQRLDASLQKCLAKDRTERYASATEMQRELIPAMHDVPQLASDESVSLDADTFILKK